MNIIISQLLRACIQLRSFTCIHYLSTLTSMHDVGVMCDILFSVRLSDILVSHSLLFAKQCMTVRMS